MTGALLLAVLLSVDPPALTPPGTAQDASPLRVSIERAAASIALLDSPATAPAARAAATHTPRCSKKAGAVLGAVIGGVTGAILAHQIYEPNYAFTHGTMVAIGGIGGAGIGAILGHDACSH